MLLHVDVCQEKFMKKFVNNRGIYKATDFSRSHPVKKLFARQGQMGVEVYAYRRMFVSINADPLAISAIFINTTLQDLSLLSP